MHSKYPNVFAPIKLGPVELRNRFYMSPHSMPFSINQAPSDDYVEYAAARARGGVGLAIISLSIPERAKAPQPNALAPGSIPAYRAVADAVHAEGAKIFAEPFYHWIAPGSWLPMGPPVPMLSPSSSQYAFLDRRSATRAMTRAEIGGMLEAFRQATVNLREAGFDGIMMHASHATLFEQFLSPYFNRRDDEYGGSLENRMRLLVEVLEAVREAAGVAMALGLRLNCDELLQGGYGTTQAHEVLGRIAEAGLIDFVDLDVAIEPQQLYLGMPPVFVEPHVYGPFVEAVRGAAGALPVLSVFGRLTSMDDAERFIASGLCDMVGAARALLAEPDFVANAEHGREERSRTCIACNACLAAVLEGMQGCPINPASYRERFWGADRLSAAPRRAKVVVVGSGPAGLEAARVSALRGHEVTLIEARDHLGGGLALWSRLPGREFFIKAVEWWTAELDHLGVEIVRGREATAEFVLAQSPDAVVLATGARFSAEGRSSHLDQPIPGHERDFVSCPEDVLLADRLPTGKIIVLDAEGNHAGAGVAEMLALGGAAVELISPHVSPLSAGLSATQEADFVMRRMLEAGVKLAPMTYVSAIGERCVKTVHTYTETTSTCTSVDAVILATGREPIRGLEKDLDGKVAQLFVVGDALAPRSWMAASFEGHKFARMIGEPNAPRSFGDAYFGADDPETYPMPAGFDRPSSRKVEELEHG